MTCSYCSEFIQDKYNLPDTSSAYIAGSVYYLSMVFSPFLGYVIVSLIIVLYSHCVCQLSGPLQVTILGKSFTRVPCILCHVYFGGTSHTVVMFYGWEGNHTSDVTGHVVFPVPVL